MPPPPFFPVQIGWITFGLSISADLLQQRCSSGPAVTGTTATAQCSNSNNCHCCYPKRDQTGTKLLPMLPLILEHGSDSSSSAVCSGQVTTRSRPTSMVIAGKQTRYPELHKRYPDRLREGSGQPQPLSPDWDLSVPKANCVGVCVQLRTEMCEIMCKCAKILLISHNCTPEHVQMQKNVCFACECSQKSSHTNCLGSCEQ